MNPQDVAVKSFEDDEVKLTLSFEYDMLRLFALHKMVSAASSRSLHLSVRCPHFFLEIERHLWKVYLAFCLPSILPPRGFAGRAGGMDPFHPSRLWSRACGNGSSTRWVFAGPNPNPNPFSRHSGISFFYLLLVPFSQHPLRSETFPGMEELRTDLAQWANIEVPVTTSMQLLASDAQLDDGAPTVPFATALWAKEARTRHHEMLTEVRFLAFPVCAFVF